VTDRSSGGSSSRRSCRDLLGASGPFSQRVDGYQVREGQMDVTEAVERLLERDGSLLCEAGTGIGKTFAYLVPALLSGRKVVISTATKTLQDQIAHRDLPLVQRVLGTEARVSVMKGLGNYVCRRRYREFLLSEEALRPGHADSLRLLRSWISETEVGDFSELATLNESSVVKAQVASSSDTRIGAKCQYFDECFVTEMKREAEAAQIIIVNHHLFFADLALRGPHPGRVLPDYDAAILDEAHQMEDTAALFFGARLTRTQMDRALSELARLFSRQGGLLKKQKVESPSITHAKRTAEEFFREVSQPKNSRQLLSTKMWDEKAAPLCRRLDDALSDLSSQARQRSDAERDDLSLSESLGQASRRMDQLRDTLERLSEHKTGRVRWAETVEGKTSVSSTPVDLSTILRERLFENIPAVALLSATLSTNSLDGEKGFSYVRSRLGLREEDSVEELSVPSPFSFSTHCALYLPRDLSQPGTDEFLDRSAARICELVDMIDGGAFVLTTSLVAMRGLHQRLRQRLSARLLLLQGERPKDALLSAFRANGAAVLVATSSFWEGVDVPGEALRLVVLEKIPFSVPTDPVFQARGKALEDVGKSAFFHLALPSAALTLKQGFGRLIRRETDVGVVALLDERVHTKAYGNRLLRALPDAYRTSDLGELRRFVSSWGHSPAGGPNRSVEQNEIGPEI
jgi:ATP-dependent DNA helicase DinG